MEEADQVLLATVLLPDLLDFPLPPPVATTEGREK